MEEFAITSKLTDNAASVLVWVGGNTITFDDTGGDRLPDVVINADGTFAA
jgi:hypothetical protein